MKKLSKKAKIAIIVICSIVLAFGAGIGFFHLWLSLQPHGNGPTPLPIEGMTTTEDSIAKYNIETNSSILNFGNRTSSTTYLYDGEVVAFEESAIVYGIEVNMAVGIGEKVRNYSLQLFDKYIKALAQDTEAAEYVNFGDAEMQVSTYDNKTYLHFFYGGNPYYLEISCSDNTWQNILFKLFGDE